MTLTSSSIAANAELTAEQIAKASSYLSETRERLVESASGLSASQWEFKPRPDCWSVGEIVEHLVLVEGRLQGIIGRMSDAPEPPADWSAPEMDAKVVPAVLDRTQRFSAPPLVHPSQHWTATEGLGRFIESRAQTIQMLSSPVLRGHVAPHPVVGLWDGYQWMLAVAAHSARHTEQIREVKADPGYPRP